MARIKIPHKAFGTFVRAANSWLARTVDAKNGLELRLANHGDRLHLSAGADARYLEALLVEDVGDLGALSEPLFLDIPSLASYDFATDGLTMVVPQVEKEDQRITFSVPSFNFRIPRKKGEIWKKNYFNFSDQAVDGLILDADTFEKLWKNIELPNSFKTPREDFQIIFEVDPGLGFIAHAYDGMGAYCHTFKNEKLQGQPGRMIFSEEFFTPCRAFEVDASVAFKITDTQCFGEFRSTNSGIEFLRWTQPRQQKRVAEIPASLEKLRSNQAIKYMLEAKSVAQNVAKVCMFLTPTEMREVPVEFHVVNDQYALLTRKPSGGGEVRAEGKLIEGSSNVELNVQASCLKDYLGEFSDRTAVHVEVFDNKVLLWQSLEGAELLYWMPVLPRTGAKGG